MVKAGITLLVSLAAVAVLWGWTAHQFTARANDTARHFALIQAHQNDSLRSILCYLERRTLASKRVPESQKAQSLHTLDDILRVGHLEPCANLNFRPRH